MTRLIDLDTFRREARTGKRPQGTVLRLAVAEPQVLDDASRTVRFCFSDGSVDRAGDTIDPQGWELGGFLKNSVALWSHDSWSPPIGRASDVGPEGNRLMGTIEFAAPDVYEFADTIYRLVKAKFINATSVGFLPLEYEWSNEDDRKYGIDFKRQELLEISVVPVPCNANALAEARSKHAIDTAPLARWAERVLDGGDRLIVPRAELEHVYRTAKMPLPPRRRDGDAAEWKCGAARDLPILESDSWDGHEAASSIFDHAGGEDFDPAKAKVGFLAWDAKNPKLRGSYKLPFARVDGGELKAVSVGIRAAASRLPQTDIPDSVQSEARSVIDHYEERMSKNARPRRRAADGASETDPSAGGFAGDCGRTADEECGMKDPAECATHGPALDDGDADKALLRALRRLVRDAADGDPAAGDGHPSEPFVRAAHAHVKAAGELHEAANALREKARDHIQKAVDTFDNPEAEKAGGADGDGIEEHVRAAHAHMKSATELRDAALEHHEKADDALEDAVDTFDNPEAEGAGGKAARAKRLAALKRAIAAP